jgi:lysophospholipase L1-like esterase
MKGKAWSPKAADVPPNDCQRDLYLPLSQDVALNRKTLRWVDTTGCGENASIRVQVEGNWRIQQKLAQVLVNRNFSLLLATRLALGRPGIYDDGPPDESRLNSRTAEHSSIISGKVSSRFRRALQRLGSGMRDLWLMVGIALVLLAGLEACYRSQAAVRRMIGASPSTSSASPYADSAWFPAYLDEYRSTFRMRWKPYVYFRRVPFQGSMIQVDGQGRRRTVPAPRTATDTVRVFFFGGSTMWGSNQRDPATIPSVTSRRLNESGRGDLAYEVTNFGESGYVFTQEMLELQLQLRAGNVPDVVVFYDGINDIAAAVQYGEAGVPQNEGNRSREFGFGRAIFGTETGIGSDWRAIRAIGSAIAQRLQFVQRIAQAGRTASPPTAPALTNDVVRTYTSNVDQIEALSRAYGFVALYVWQPALQTTTKRLTPFERELRGALERNTFQRRMIELHRQVAVMMDSAMVPRVGPRFINEARLFAYDTASVFTDDIGHTTEKAVPVIVDGFLPQLSRIVDAQRPRAP